MHSIAGFLDKYGLDICGTPVISLPSLNLTGLVRIAGVAALASLAGCDHKTVASPVPSAEAPAAVAATPSDDSTQASASNSEPSASAAAAPTPETPSPPPTAQRPPADRTRTRPGDAEKITFDDLNLGMQADVVFREFMVTDRVKELDGKRISIIGYMHGGQAAQRGIKEFILLKNTQCKFGPGGQADHLTNVILRADNSVAFSPSPLKVEGTLRLEPFQGPDGNTWSIYRLEDAQIR